jgi:hypothetical protein
MYRLSSMTTHRWLAPALLLGFAINVNVAWAQSSSAGGQAKAFKRQWLFQVQPSHTATWEQLQGLLRESQVQINGGPDAVGALTVAVELTSCKAARRVLEMAPAIDLVRDAPEQPTQGLLPPDHCRLTADER